eukprot:3098171-Pyramimonas_sp.AAC.1
MAGTGSTRCRSACSASGASRSSCSRRTRRSKGLEGRALGVQEHAQPKGGAEEPPEYSASSFSRSAADGTRRPPLPCLPTSPAPDLPLPPFPMAAE